VKKIYAGKSGVMPCGFPVFHFHWFIASFVFIVLFSWCNRKAANMYIRPELRREEIDVCISSATEPIVILSNLIFFRQLSNFGEMFYFRNILSLFLNSCVHKALSIKICWSHSNVKTSGMINYALWSRQFLAVVVLVSVADWHPSWLFGTL